MNVGWIDLIYCIVTPRDSFVEERVSLFRGAPTSDLEQEVETQKGLAVISETVGLF